ncbi:MAG: ATP-binding cassette domain-containing protein [Verrucomicrobiota bacterium]
MKKEPDDYNEQEEKDSPGIWWVLKMLWPSIRAHQKTALLLLLALTGHVIVTVVLAISLENLFDESIPNADIPGVLKTGGVLLAVIFGASVASIYQARLVAELSAGVVFDLQRRIYDHILGMPSSTVSKARSGDLLARFSTDLAPVAQAVGVGVPFVAMYLLVVIGCLGAILWIDWRAGVGTLVLFGGGALLSHGLPELAAEATRRFKETEARVLSLASESVRSHLLINIFGLRSHFGSRFHEVASDQRAAQKESGYRIYITEMMAEYGSMALGAVAIVAGALLAIDGYVTLGALVAIFTLLVHLQEAIYEVTSAGTTLLEASGGLARIQELFDEEQEIDHPHQRVAQPLQQEIRFEDVGLSFGEKEVLSRVSCSIQCGQHVAIVGRSGSGKSTLLRLLMCLLEPASGQITWDGESFSGYSRHSLRQQMGVVFQEPLLIGRTMREVIAPVSEDISDARMEAAVRAASLEDLVKRLPDGLNSPLGEEGRELSLGQKMRIALARALVRNPSLLVLDEISASLDMATEEQIIETINALPAGQTVVSVTHRLSVARTADHIIVLGDGVVLEAGSHEALIQSGGYYANMNSQQTAITVAEDAFHIAPERLQQIPILNQVDAATLKSLSRAFSSCEFSPSDTIIQQGDPSGEFYILFRGKLQVLVGEQEVGRLEDGDFFGEMGLLFDTPRTATIQALTPAHCLRIERDDFEQLVAGVPAIEKTLQAAARLRGSRI